MKSRTTMLVKIASLLAIAGTFGPSAVFAQEQQDENGKPKPAAHAPLIDNEDQDTTDPNALQPDTTPLTGVQSPGLGTAEFRHSYWVPGFTVANTVQSNPYGGGGTGNSSGWFDTTYLAGNLSLQENWSHSRLALNYSGGGYFSTNSAQGNGSYQQLGLSQSFTWRRWRLQFFDEFAYLPTTQFGFGGLSGIGVPGIGGSLTPGGPGLGDPFVPDQSVFSNGPRYSNSFATQATYELSRRGSVTLVGSYGILRFTESGSIGNDDAIGSIGYNYTLSKKDTLGVVYRFTAYHFMGFSQALGNHVFNLAYSRRITGRLAFALFGGPEITTFRIPIGTSRQRIDGAFGTNLSYAFKNGGVNFGYTRGTSGGSGVLVGATEDRVNAGGTRQLSRLWKAHGDFGLGRVHAFAPSNGPSSPGYNSYYFGAAVDRPLGRNASLSLGYTAYVQELNDAACAGCGTSTQHQISVAFQWHARPFVLH